MNTIAPCPPRRLLLALPLALLAGCGSGGASSPLSSGDHPAPSRAGDARIRQALALPGRVPLRSGGDAAPADVRVVRTWLDRLSTGDVTGAARVFALPSRFQNISSVAVIRSLRDAEAVNTSLPCGARLLHAGAAAGFVVYEARLTDRPGGQCGAGVGGSARGAIRVRDGHIAEWYRLPDTDRPPPSGPGGGGPGGAPAPDAPLV